MGTATIGTFGDVNFGTSRDTIVNSLAWGSKWEGTITVGYRPTVDKFDRSGNIISSRDLTAREIKAITDTLTEYEKYTSLDFNFIGADTNVSSDVQFVLLDDRRVDFLGVAEPPGETMDEFPNNPNMSEIFIPVNNFANRAGALDKGGYDFITFIHEFGHAMGLAHPHDDGGTATDPSEWLPGVPYNDPFGNYGDFGFNQGIFTTMSYNDGWPLVVRNGAPAFGYQAGLMAFDILTLQLIYGARNDATTDDTDNDGNINDVYALPTKNTVGTGYSCIYDTAGADTISFAGSASCVIDLRSASGLMEEGGGGFVSHGKGVKGGFTIAVGVTIENATSGKGADFLIGNSVDNILTGNGGKDTYTGNGGADQFVFLSLKDTATTATRADLITDFTVGSDDINLAAFDIDTRTAGVQTLAWSFIDEAAFTAAGQVNSFYNVKTNQTFISINTDADTRAEAMIVLSGNLDLTGADFIFV